jgi:hypothetical protein
MTKSIWINNNKKKNLVVEKFMFHIDFILLYIEYCYKFVLLLNGICKHKNKLIIYINEIILIKLIKQTYQNLFLKIEFY